MRTFSRLLTLSLSLLVLLSASGAADERILSFDSFVQVKPDGSQEVTETIRVQAEGRKIKRGIFRDFPTSYRDRYGHHYRVAFNVLEVLHDGAREPYHLNPLSNGVRVYIGDKDVYIPAGEHTYTLRYATDRQLGFFKEFDELYWNVTGNGWEFPIEKVSCAVSLPGYADAQVMQRDGYTGPYGSQGKDFLVETDWSNRIHFVTTRTLNAGEGLTIAIRWPKGFVMEPALSQRIGYFFKDNAGLLAGLIGLLVVLGYYLYVWNAVGRDPQKGIIIPLYEPDKDLSPAVMRYLLRMGFDHKVFSASLINMAVKGTLSIHEEDGEYTLKKTAQYKGALSSEESAAAKVLFESGDSLTLKNRNHLIINAAMAKF